MSEQEKLVLRHRKEMLFRFLKYMQENKGDYDENHFYEQVDSILDQIIRINYQLNKSE